MTYRITLAVTRTKEVFMYHNTRNYNEALSLLDSYDKHHGITVKLEKVEHA